ncbi:MAG: DUF58 domain-containing protein [Bacteroidales bacterium]|nr:DUF58 domain-containing protein [Bacteroidales bacterium]
MDQKIDIKQFCPFNNLEFIANQLVEGFITGLHQSPFHGFSVEFAEYRPYNTGESTKNIDWKLYGKTDKFFVKEYEEETNLRCQLVLDCSSSMYFPPAPAPTLEHPNKIYFSAYAAAALIQLFRRQRDAAGLSLFAEQLLLHTPAKSGTVHHKMMYAELEKLLQYPPAGQKQNTNIAACLHEIAERLPRRSLVIIFTDGLDFEHKEDFYLSLQHLRHNKHSVVIFHVYDRHLEMDFDFSNRPYRFIDMETAQEIKINAAELKNTYQKSMRQFRDELKTHCGQYQIDLVETDINAGFHQILINYLLKRKKLY